MTTKENCLEFEVMRLQSKTECAQQWDKPFPGICKASRILVLKRGIILTSSRENLSWESLRLIHQQLLQTDIWRLWGESFLKFGIWTCKNTCIQYVPWNFWPAVLKLFRSSSCSNFIARSQTFFQKISFSASAPVFPRAVQLVSNRDSSDSFLSRLVPE